MLFHLLQVLILLKTRRFSVSALLCLVGFGLLPRSQGPCNPHDKTNSVKLYILVRSGNEIVLKLALE